MKSHKSDTFDIFAEGAETVLGLFEPMHGSAAWRLPRCEGGTMAGGAYLCGRGAILGRRLGGVRG